MPEVKSKKVQVCYCKEVHTVRLAQEWGREMEYGKDCWCSFKKGGEYRKVGDVALKRKLFKEIPK